MPRVPRRCRPTPPFMSAFGAVGMAILLAAGCSHEQKPPTNTESGSVALASAKPKARAKPAASPAPATRDPLEKSNSSIYFDFDSYALRDDARPVLTKVADELSARPNDVRIEGNCDELGTTEYNLALGEQRARAAKEYLVHLGVPSSRIAIASWGSQRPRYPGHDDLAHAKNRRDDVLVR